MIYQIICIFMVAYFAAVIICGSITLLIMIKKGVSFDKSFFALLQIYVLSPVVFLEELVTPIKNKIGGNKDEKPKRQ